MYQFDMPKEPVTRKRRLNVNFEVMAGRCFEEAVKKLNVFHNPNLLPVEIQFLMSLYVLMDIIVKQRWNWCALLNFSERHRLLSSRSLRYDESTLTNVKSTKQKEIWDLIIEQLSDRFSELQLRDRENDE
ncbi:hypothetical protein R5R35_008726 [Gryllus longicercus]|uniref:Uncharacterized protein n=1 Tax=Gryllus longicercus TaxID=2509291 RepID=A0AAN9VLW5_9ORTH